MMAMQRRFGLATAGVVVVLPDFDSRDPEEQDQSNLIQALEVIQVNIRCISVREAAV